MLSFLSRCGFLNLRTTGALARRSFTSSRTLRQDFFRPYGPDAVDQYRVFAQMPAKVNVLRPTLISLGITLGVYVVAAHVTNVYTDRYLARYPVGSYDDGTLIKNGNFARVHYENAVTREHLARLKAVLDGVPVSLGHTILECYVWISGHWDDAQQSDRVNLLVTAVCSAVFMGWRIPRLFPHMFRSWLHHPFSGRSFTTITSAFSHITVAHLAWNICGLWLLKPAIQWLSEDTVPKHLTIQEGPSTYHLMAYFVTAGMFSKLVSHYVEMILKARRVRSVVPCSLGTLLDGSSGFVVFPFLGLSGALCSSAGLYAFAFPEARTVIPPLGVDMSARTWIIGAILFDVLGVIRRWPYGHVAHLAGWAFGIFYAHYGLQCWETTRVAVAHITGSSLANVSLSEEERKRTLPPVIPGRNID